MAVCNLFNDLTNVSGNFMLFSQYVEDITHNYADGDNFKVVPSKFVALNIDYSKLQKYGNTGDDLNIIVPRFFQNCFENGCAYGRVNYHEFYTKSLFLNESYNWDPTISRNLFWNLLKQERLINESNYNDNSEFINEIVYYGDVSMHSYNEQQGMGYNELYCYIPTDAQYVRASFRRTTDGSSQYDTNESDKLEGHDILIGKYPKEYYYLNDFTLGFESDALEKLPSRNESKYDINTIVVLYDVLEKDDDTWKIIYNCIPMGMYIAGNFDSDNKLTNTIVKHVKHTASSYNTGTAYGLRICTRFTATSSNGILTNSEVIADDTNYVNISQLMTGMNENLSRMREISKMSYDAASQHAELLSVFKNSKTNIPYIKKINGQDCWFINGKYVSNVFPETYAYATKPEIRDLFKQEEQL